MNTIEFRRANEASWRTLESSLTGRRQRFGGGSELAQFAVLYRKVAADLSYAQTYFPGEEVTRYLNDLVATAHNRFYRQRDSRLSAVWRFYTGGFPALFRQLGVYIGLSTFVTLAAALFGYLTVLSAPLQAYQLLPASFLNQLDPTMTGPRAMNAPILSSVIMTHNILVTLQAFVLGITLGILTLYVLWQNGLIIGVLAALFQTHGNSSLFWSLIVPHGVTELMAIFIGGGAGLYFAHRILAPGSHRRMTSIIVGLRDAVQLMLGTVPMFIIAGTIEGFVTPSALPQGVKFGVAVVSALAWLWYFGWVGRHRTPVRAGQSAPAVTPAPRRKSLTS